MEMWMFQFVQVITLCRNTPLILIAAADFELLVHNSSAADLQEIYIRRNTIIINWLENYQIVIKC